MFKILKSLSKSLGSGKSAAPKPQAAPKAGGTLLALAVEEGSRVAAGQDAAGAVAAVEDRTVARIAHRRVGGGPVG